jgi:hypothetical protein
MQDLGSPWQQLSTALYGVQCESQAHVEQCWSTVMDMAGMPEPLAHFTGLFADTGERTKEIWAMTIQMAC